MKNIVIEIKDYELNDFKSHKDEIKDYVYLVLLISSKIINGSYMKVDDVKKIHTPFLLIDVCKHSRAFVFISYNKYYTISYPLNIKILDNTPKLYSTEKGIEINNQLVSECIGIVKSLRDGGNFLDVWMENDEPYTQSSIDILELIFHTEPSYLRYDYDKIGAKGRQEKHPEHHLDVNMSRRGKYKLGLYEHLSQVDFINLVKDDTDCLFLSKYKGLNLRKSCNKNIKIKNKKR